MKSVYLTKTRRGNTCWSVAERKAATYEVDIPYENEEVRILLVCG
jgi:hypothetical protein